MVCHRRTRGAAVGHEVVNGSSIGGLLLHGFELFFRGGQVEVRHIDGAAFDIDGNEQRLPVAGSGGFGGVQVFACHVDFYVLDGADLDLAVVVGVRDHGRRSGFGRFGGFGCFGFLAAVGNARAGAQGQYQNQRKQQC